MTVPHASDALRWAKQARIRWELERLAPEAKLWRKAGDIPRAMVLEKKIARLIAELMAL